MNFIRISRSRAVALALGAFFVTGAFAQTHDHSNMGNMQMAATTSSAAPKASAMADGEIRKIDLNAQTITLKHGPIKSMEMPAMTMAYAVKNVALLDKIKVGDKVKFSAEMRETALIITAIELAR